MLSSCFLLQPVRLETACADSSAGNSVRSGKAVLGKYKYEWNNDGQSIPGPFSLVYSFFMPRRQDEAQRYVVWIPRLTPAARSLNAQPSTASECVRRFPAPPSASKLPGSFLDIPESLPSQPVIMVPRRPAEWLLIQSRHVHFQPSRGAQGEGKVENLMNEYHTVCTGFKMALTRYFFLEDTQVESKRMFLPARGPQPRQCHLR